MNPETRSVWCRKAWRAVCEDVDCPLTISQVKLLEREGCVTIIENYGDELYRYIMTDKGEEIARDPQIF